MKKFFMTLAAAGLSAGLFAQAVVQKSDATKVRVFTPQTFSFTESQDTIKRLQDDKELKAKLQRIVGQDGEYASAKRRVLNGEMITKADLSGFGLVAFLDARAFKLFAQAVKDDDTADVTRILKDWEENTLDKKNKVDVAVFNNIKKFHEQSLSAKDPKAAFTQSVKFDYDKSNRTYKDGYNRFFTDFGLRRIAKIIPFEVKNEPKIQPVYVPEDSLPKK